MEKWLNGGSQMGPRQPVRRQSRGPQRTGQVRYQAPGKNLALARFGNPQRLFKDSDKDGVPNVFDCQPFNKKKQDVIAPSNFGGGMRDMYSRRESNRQNRMYFQQMREAQRLEMLRLKELERIGQLPVQVVDNTRTIYQNTPYVSTAGGKWVSATSKEGQKAIKDFTSSSKTTTTAATSNGNAKFMESLGYQGQSTATGTVWTKPTATQVANNLISGGSSRSSSGSSSGTSGSSSAPKTSTSYSSKPGFIGPVRPSNYKPAPAPAPKKSVVSRVVSWFRRR